MTRVAVLDYGMGNLRSVAKSLERVGAEVDVVDAVPSGAADLLVVPGQGHFGACIRTLGPAQLDAIRSWVAADRPYLGICLGLQLLFEGSDEDSGGGAAILSGRVVRFRPGRKVPHIGWNTVMRAAAGDPWFAGLDPETRFYFVHSYFPAPQSPDVIAVTSEHEGETFAAAVARGPLLATQFHPEKSGDAGLELLGRVVREAA